MYFIFPKFYIFSFAFSRLLIAQYSSKYFIYIRIIHKILRWWFDAWTASFWSTWIVFHKWFSFLLKLPIFWLYNHCFQTQKSGFLNYSPMISGICPSSSSNNTVNAEYYFVLQRPSFLCQTATPNCIKPLDALYTSKSILTVSFHLHSMHFRSTFL